MKQTKNKKLSMIGLFAVMIVGLIATTAFAFGGMGHFSGNEDARAAVEAGDYTAWKDAHLADLTEERFNEISTKHAEREASREAVQDAVDAGDLDAWKLAMGDRPMAQEMTEEGFAIVQEIHVAKEAGDIEKVNELHAKLHETLGLEFGRGQGMLRQGRGPGMGHGRDDDTRGQGIDCQGPGMRGNFI